MVPRVAILLCTFNGTRFLPQQLASYESQSAGNWRIFASDDGSEDGTYDLLLKFREKLGRDRVHLRRGPGKGFVQNFLSLACDQAIECDYYAFSDQDDVWESEKLSRALGWLTKVPSEIPAFYGSRTRLIDADGQEIGLSPLFSKRPSFRNALVQSIAGGNTMVFNATLRRLLVEGGDDINIPAHDWWLYLVTTATGGQVHYDPFPTVRYRVHQDNLIGSNIGWLNRGRRILMLKEGRFRNWIDLNVAALARLHPRMTASNRKIFDEFCSARNESFVNRVSGMARCGVYRQTFLGNLGMIAGAVAKKI
jgi:glycosyltransferase involved in cell wall biosynthesis